MSRRIEIAPREKGEKIVFLVGCGKSKGTRPAPVRFLYASPVFSQSIQVGELLGDATFALSARSGLLNLDEVVKPHDPISLKGERFSVRRVWGETVVASVLRWTLGTSSRIRVVILAGEIYARPVIASVNNERKRPGGVVRWSEPIDPLRGMSIGRRLATLGATLRHELAKRPTFEVG